MKKSETNKILALIFSVFPRVDISEDVVLEAYHGLIGHLEFETALLAVQKCLSTSHWEPRPADILYAAVEVEVPEVELPSPAQAWDLVLAATWSQPDAMAQMCPVLKRTVRALGSLRDIQTSPVLWETRKQFIAAYTELRNAEIERRCMPAKWRVNVLAIQTDRAHAFEALSAPAKRITHKRKEEDNE